MPTGPTGPSTSPGVHGALTRRRRVMALFEVLSDLPESIRENALNRECADEPEVRAELREMLGLSHAAPDNAVYFGPWRVLDVLGHGGMGAVYKVERDAGDFKQVAALKRIRVGLDTQAARQRFLRERKIIARLRHENIALLVDGGVEGDTPWFAMELVDGERIDHWCDSRRLDIRHRVVLFLQVLDAVAEAHRALIVHRDLKPGNVLVDDGGHVKLLDFGVAKLIEDEGNHTRTQERVFTPEFASPEQLNNEPVGTASDIYQLGMLLYDLLAGRNAYGVTSGTTLLSQLTALEQNPQRLPRAAEMGGETVANARGARMSQLVVQLSGDLNAIVTCAISRNPRERYSSVEAFAEDLRAWLDGRPVKVREPTLMYRASRFVKRNRLGVAAAGLLVLAIATGVAATLYQARQARAAALVAERARDAARNNEQITAAVEESFQQMLTHALMNDGGRGITVRDMIEQSVARLRPDTRGPRDARIVLLLDIAESFVATSQSDVAERILKQVAPHIEQLKDTQPRLELKRDGILARIEADRNNPHSLVYFERARKRFHAMRGDPEESLFEDFRQIANFEIIVLNRFGHIKESEARAKELFELTRNRYGLENTRTLEIARSYTFTLLRANKNDEAMKIRAYTANYLAKHDMRGTALELTALNQFSGAQLYNDARQAEVERSLKRSLEIASNPRFDPLGNIRVDIHMMLARLYEMQGKLADYAAEMAVVEVSISKLYDSKPEKWRNYYLLQSMHAWRQHDAQASTRMAAQGLTYSKDLPTYDDAISAASLHLAHARGVAGSDPTAAISEANRALAIMKPYPENHEGALFYALAAETYALAGEKNMARDMAAKSDAARAQDAYLSKFSLKEIARQVALAR